MKTNLFLTLLAFCLLLSSYLAHHSTQKTVAVSRSEPSSEPLFTLRPEEITTVKISDRQHCLLIRNPPDQPRPEATEQLLVALTQARVVRHFSPLPADLPAYGVTQAVRRIEVFGAGEQHPQIVELGVLNPIGNAVYAKRTDSPEVLLVGGYFLTVLEFVIRQMSSVNDLTCTE